jgi:hypothetical protein
MTRTPRNKICTLLEAILQQNYFTFQDQVSQTDQGIAMGSPVSGITAEIFLQHLERTHIKFLLETKHIAFYARYVDDILIIYNATHTNPDTITQYANSMRHSLQLNPTRESKGQINFLIRNDSQLEIDVFRKPTTTDTTVNYKSNLPSEHKLSAYRYHMERMLNLPLNNDR